MSGSMSQYMAFGMEGAFRVVAELFGVADHLSVVRMLRNIGGDCWKANFRASSFDSAKVTALFWLNKSSRNKLEIEVSLCKDYDHRNSDDSWHPSEAHGTIETDAGDVAFHVWFDRSGQVLRLIPAITPPAIVELVILGLQE